MKRSEWIEIVAVMRTNWPHAEIPKPSIAKWFEDLQHLAAEQVRVAVEALYRDGREYPPNGAHILGKLSDLSRDDSDWGDAYKLAKRASLKADTAVGLEWLREQSPAAAQAVVELCGGVLRFQIDNESTMRAQFRDTYNAICARGKRDDVYAGLPSAGLRGLESGPRRLGSAMRRALPEKAEASV